MKRTKSNLIIALQAATIIRFLFYFAGAMIVLFLFIGLLTALKPEYRVSSNSLNEATKQMAGKTLYKHLMKGNMYLQQSLPDGDVPTIGEQLFQYVTNITMDDPRSLLGRELPGYSLFDGDILIAGEGTNYTNMPIESAPLPESLEKDSDTEKIEEKDDVEDKKQTAPKEKRVFIYFSHTRESYLPLLKGVTDPNAASHSKVNVTLVGDKLKEALEEKGVGAEVDKTDVYALLQKKNLNYASSYTESRKIVEEAIAQKKDAQYYVDVHRDSQRKKVTTIKIDGKDYAKICFIIGGENPNYEKNLKLAKEIHKRISDKYPGLSRGVFEKRGASTNGKFNQDLSENAMLVEAGGVDNTMEELDRSMEVLAGALSEHILDAEAVMGDGS
ncbi:stage II sporulation protein P [Bacillus sp. FJAT-27916]|uniref:stage II sporulation protein P n=1 Tax=Bacillaceae TaxID=186817 RepID=UPI000670B92D|nr:stage II sporulation protein P [Bacillus sp. FJAT-27916]KMY43706.1 stage II sporulation protein P [Bacillus sp. FJAT-27916]